MQPRPMTDIRRLEYAIRRSLGEDFRLHCQAIVNVGCGYCDEGDALLELFPGATLTLVDVDRACIDELERRLSFGSIGRLRLVWGDASRLAEIAPGPYDFAIIRHPDLRAKRPLWVQVFGAVWDQVRVGGTILTAAFSVDEAEIARDILQNLPGGAFSTDWLGAPPVALAGNDRYILLWVKR